MDIFAKLEDFLAKLKEFSAKLKVSENPFTCIAAKWLKKQAWVKDKFFWKNSTLTLLQLKNILK